MASQAGRPLPTWRGAWLRFRQHRWRGPLTADLGHAGPYPQVLPGRGPQTATAYSAPRLIK